MFITRVSIGNPVFATMIMLFFVVLGVFSFFRVPVQQFPKVDFPVVSIKTVYPGSSPEVVETEISKPIERAVNTVSGLKEIRSTSYQGLSIVTAIFSLSVDPVVAANDIREKISAIAARLPEEAQSPEVLRFDPFSRPILLVTVTSPIHKIDYLTDFIEDKIIPRLQTISGVGLINSLGEQERQIFVSVHPDALASFGLGIDRLLSVIGSDNQDLSVGSFVTQGSREPIVEIRNRVRDPKDLENLYIAPHIQLHDVATVSTGSQERQSAALKNNQFVLGLEIVKTADGNLLKTADLVFQEIEKMNQDFLGEKIHLSVTRDSSKPIRVAVQRLIGTIIEGVVLTILTVFLFLGSWRSTIITGLALPITLISAFAILYVMKFSINFISLMALSLSVGFLVDDAIVVRENIIRHLEMGKSLVQASLDGTEEIGLAVIATTLTIVSVFLPIGFMGGIIGQFFKEFGITVSFTVLVSLLVSFTLDPMLSSIWHDPDVGGKSSNAFLNAILRLLFFLQDKFNELYLSSVRWCIKNRIIVMILSFCILFFSFYIIRFINIDFVPKGDYGEIIVKFQVQAGSSIDITTEKAKQATEILHSFPEVKDVLVAINSRSSMKKGKIFARLYVELVPLNQRQRSIAQLVPLIRKRLFQVGGIKLSSVGVEEKAGSSATIDVNFLGDNYSSLRQLARKLSTRLEASPIIWSANLDSDSEQPLVEVTVRSDKLRSIGVSVNYLANVLRILFGGDSSQTWQSHDGHRYKIMVRVDAANRKFIHDLSHLYISLPGSSSAPKARLVPLSELIFLKERTEMSSLEHLALRKNVRVAVSVRPGVGLGEATTFVQSIIKKMNVPSGFSVELTGQTKDMKESFHYAVEALVLAVLFIYMILASQFHSFLDPMIIMISLPFSFVGVVFSLVLFQSSLNLFSMIGTIMLMGLVTKNGILLVDFANQSMRKGLNSHDAILSAAHVRLRPILMTTVSMVAGMLPAAFSSGEGSEISAPMAQAVSGGVVASAVLTLLVAPVIFTCFADMKSYFGFHVKTERDRKSL